MQPVKVLASPAYCKSNVVVHSKESLISRRLGEATLNWVKGFSLRKGVSLKKLLLRKKVGIMRKTFSTRFFPDCCVSYSVRRLALSAKPLVTHLVSFRGLCIG